MTWQDRADKLGGWVLIYEGFVLASRVLNPRLTRPPAVSEMVWRAPLPARLAISMAVGGYLGVHWVAGPRKKVALGDSLQS